MYDRGVRLLLSIVLLAGCDRILGIDDLSGPSDASSEPNSMPDCTAQRVVHLVAGDGSLAWFTLAWPLPDVITGFQPAYAYDDPLNVVNASTDVAHPLFVRRVGGGSIWSNSAGTHPDPSAFVAGVNETHTAMPTSTTVNHGSELVAAGASLQTSLAPTMPVLLIGSVGPYGPANGAPPVTSAMTVDEAIASFDAATQQQLRPTATQLARYVPPVMVQPQEIDFATELAFAANAFRAGVIATLVMPAFLDDPHDAFMNMTATARANHLAQALDAFYRDLEMGSETTCGQAGHPLSLADNTVLIVSGDTPKNSYVANGWADGTTGNANVLYVRSNGFTRPGWFGDISPMARINFDPTTGALDPMGPNTASTDAAWAGALYAIARGDKMAVARFTMVPFAGVIAP
jgi:hypothetical protein